MSSSSESWLGAEALLERRLAAVLVRLDNQRRVQENKLRLGVADLRLLWLFSDGQPRTLKEIAVELHLEQSTVNRQVNAATSSGLLARMRRRGSAAYEFDRTAAGGQAYEEDTATTLGAYSAALDAMGSDDAERFVTLAQVFLEHYRREVEAP